MKLTRRKIRSLILEVISEGYYIGSDDPSKTVRADDAYASGTDMLDKRIASHPALKRVASDGDEGINQARDLAQSIYGDEFPDAENTALDIGPDKIKRMVDTYGPKSFDKVAAEFTETLEEMLDDHNTAESIVIYGQKDPVSDDMIAKLGLEEVPGVLRPIIIIVTFDSKHYIDGSSLGPEDFYILLHPDEISGKSIVFAGVSVQNFYYAYEVYYELKEFTSMSRLVEDVLTDIYQESGLY
jgi:hypothetical protein